MRTRLLLLIGFLSIVAPAFGQTPATAPPPPPPPPPPAAARPQREGQPVNVKVELTITDQRGGAAAVKKTLTAVVSDGGSGSIRSSAVLPGSNGGALNVPLNLDTFPRIMGDGKVRLTFTLQYDIPAVAATTPAAGPSPFSSMPVTNLRESLNVVLENGKPIVVTQSADPVGDRQVTVEVKATIMR